MQLCRYFHFQFHSIYLLFQKDEHQVVPVQEDKPFTEYVSAFDWYNVNTAS